MQLVRMRFGSHSGTQGATLSYHGNKPFRSITDRGMHGEDDTAHNNIISGWEVFVGRIKGGTQGALFMCYTVLL